MYIDVKEENRKASLTVIRNGECVSVHEVAAVTNQSYSTALRAVYYLQETGLVEIGGKGPSTDEGGKKPVLYRLNPRHRHFLGLHVHDGGVALGLGGLGGTLLDWRDLPMPEGFTPVDALAAARTAYDGMQNAFRLDEENLAGVAVAGLEATGETALRAAAARHFPSMPALHCDSATRFGAYAEYRAGGFGGVKNMLVLGAQPGGLTAAALVNGDLWRRPLSRTMEIAHLIVDTHTKRRCRHGCVGCLEAMASPQALEEYARAAYAANKSSLLFAATDSPGCEEIYAAALQGDHLACLLVHEQARYLAFGILTAGMFLDPELVVFQGAFTHGGGVFMQSITEWWQILSSRHAATGTAFAFSQLGRTRCAMGQVYFAADNYLDATPFPKKPASPFTKKRSSHLRPAAPAPSRRETAGLPA